MHIPARIGALLLLATGAFAADRFVVKVSGDVNDLARRHNLRVIKSLIGSANGIHVLEAPQGSSSQQVLSSLASPRRLAEKLQLAELYKITQQVLDGGI